MAGRNYGTNPAEEPRRGDYTGARTPEPTCKHAVGQFEGRSQRTPRLMQTCEIK